MQPIIDLFDDPNVSDPKKQLQLIFDRFSKSFQEIQEITQCTNQEPVSLSPQNYAAQLSLLEKLQAYLQKISNLVPYLQSFVTFNQDSVDFFQMLSQSLANITAGNQLPDAARSHKLIQQFTLIKPEPGPRTLVLPPHSTLSLPLV